MPFSKFLDTIQENFREILFKKGIRQNEPGMVQNITVFTLPLPFQMLKMRQQKGRCQRKGPCTLY